MKLNYQNYLLGLLFCFSFLSYAQVGVNTTNPQAQLDVVASNPTLPSNTDGFLVPRIDTFPATNPTATQQGMLVYLTTTVGTNSPGFYFWDNTTVTWKPIAATSTVTDWSLTGNAGTISGTNFIGTTDNQSLDIRTNNAIKVRITTKGQIEVLNTGQSVFVGENAGLNDDLSANQNVFVGAEAGRNNTTGTGNTFVGQNAGTNTTTGNANVFIGRNAGSFNSTGTWNNALGDSALQNNSTGNNNVAFGRAALANNSTGASNIAIGRLTLASRSAGDFNTAVGDRAFWINNSGNNNVSLGADTGANNTSGSNNTFIGHNSGAYNNGSSNVFLGYLSGSNETGSDKLYIDNSNTSNPLIYGDFATNLLRVNGTLNVNNAYNLPTTAGATNQVLQTDGAGNTAWVNPTVVAETDPQVSSTTTNYIPKWNGTTLVDGQVFDNGTNVGIGTTTPTGKVHVVGNLKLDNGKLPFVNTGNSVFIGENAGLNDDLSDNRNVLIGTGAGTTGTTNNNSIAIGYNSLNKANSDNNIAIGNNALNANTTGYQNNAFGNNAMLQNINGINNVAFGNSSLRSNSTGDGNTAIGFESLYNNLNGNSNTVIGASAGYLATGNNNVFIGYYAGYNETGSNKLYIDNTNTANPLIWGDFATNLLRVNGTLNINNAYNLPTTAGSANQVLQTNGAGVASWVNPSSLTITESDPQVSSTATNYIPKWSGTTLVDGQVFDDGTNIGIGTTTPSSRFHISSNNTATNTTIESGNLQYPTALSILPSSHAFSKRAIIKLDDWHLLQDLTGTGTKDFALYQNSTGQQRLTIGTSGNVGIGMNNPTEKLEVNGKTKTTNIQVTNGATNGFILQSDINGNGTWVNPTTLTVTETDPQVSSTTTNRVPKWNGTSLVDGQVFDNGTNVGIGTVTPTDKIHIVGNVKIDGGKLPFVNTGQSVFIGENAGLNDDLTANQNVFIGWESGKLNTSGNLNTFIGHGSGMVNNTGSANSALGQFALGSTTTGSNNTAVGRAAISRSTSGTFNTAIGYSALENNTIGNYNVSIGDSSLGSNLTGNFNTALGSGAGYNNNGSYNVFLGVDAGFNETGSNKLYIDNTNTNNPLIYGDFTTNLLRINGTLNVNNAYNLPTTSGTANQVLQTNGAGNTTWVDSTTLTVTETDPQVSSSGVNYVPRWIGTTLDDGSIQDDGTSIGIATAPLAGNRVTINGKTSTTNLQISNGASNGFVLQSDALGNGTWVNSSTLTVTETDPQVSSTTTNFIPKWNGATLIDGLIYNGASNIGISTSTPSEKLHLFGGNMLIDRGTAIGGTSRKLTVEGARGSVGASFAQIDLNNYDTDTASSYTGASIQSHNTQSTEDGDLRFFTNNGTLTERMNITNNGNVGIGTSAPSQALLVVNGSASNTLIAYGYLNNTPTPAGYLFAAATNNYSIYASNHIAASEFNAFSDARIKNIKGLSNSKHDLETLSQIEITNYTLKDSISKGNNNYKKVIAQQVEKVYPQAVSKLTDVVPDIYQQAEMVNGFIALKNDVKQGEKIKIITQAGEQIVAVLEANSEGFKIDSNQTESVFVFGRQVNDFRSVDYEALSTLNISATQELLKRIQQLENENAALKSKIETLDQLKAEIESIKKTLTNEPTQLAKTN